DYDFNSDTFNLEHVLPQNPGAGWEQFSEEEIEAMVFRLGNMTLLQSSANRDQGNEAYAAKRPVYTASGFAVTCKLAEENAEWTPERLAARQTWMAKQATAIWRLARLP
ncbi:MAG: HNH endonuclease family protein, partial [Blastocatellia bacterium]